MTRLLFTTDKTVILNGPAIFTNGTGGVDSVFGRAGNVIAQPGDYDTLTRLDIVTELTAGGDTLVTTSGGNVGIGTLTPRDYGLPGAFRTLEVAADVLSEIIVSSGGVRRGSLIGFGGGVTLASDSEDLYLAANTNNQLNLLRTGEVQAPNLQGGVGTDFIKWNSATGDITRDDSVRPDSLGQITLAKAATGAISYYDTLADVFAAAGAGDTVYIPTGDYSEDITIPDGVFVEGIGARCSNRILGASAASGIRVTLGDGASLKNVFVQAATNGDPAITNVGGGRIVGIHINGQGASSIGVDVAAVGVLQLEEMLTSGTFDAECLFSAECQVLSTDSTHEAASVSAFRMSHDDVDIVIDGLHVSDTAALGRGLDVNAACKVRTVSAVIDGATQIPAYLSANSDGARIYINGTTLEGTLYDWFVDPAATGVGTEIFATGSAFRSERLSATPTWIGNVTPSFSVLNEAVWDDRAQLVVGEFTVGVPTIPSESSFGEGDSTVFGMVVLTSNAASTAFTDVTEAARSPDSSPFTFQGLTPGFAIYFGNLARTFPSIKFSIDSLRVGGSVVWEYWDGLAWTPVNIMVTDAEPPAPGQRRKSHAQVPWENTDGEQVRFGLTPGWTQTVVGVTTAYWMRCRIDTAITILPVFERTKLGTNHYEINGDGSGEGFGDAIGIDELEWHKNLEDDLSGVSPGNTTIQFSANVQLTIVDNVLQNGVVDGNGGVIQVPDWLDTSRPVFLAFKWRPSSNGAGDVEIETYQVRSMNGNVLNGTLPQDLRTYILPVLAGQRDVQMEEFFEFDLSDLTPDDTLALAYRRDATAGNLNDTFGGNVEIVQVRLIGSRWR